MSDTLSCTPHHAPAAAAIHAAAFPAAERWSADAIATLLAQPGVFGLLSASGGLLLARVAADEAEILTLAVDPAARRRGIARALLQAAHARAAHGGARTVFLEVAAANAPALALYAAAGYAVVGHRRRYYPSGADALVLRRALPQERLVSLDPILRDRIAGAVADGFPEQIAFTQSLIRFASARGAEHTIQDFLFRALRQRGYAVDRFAMDRAGIAGHPGAGMVTEAHSDAPIVVGIHRPRTEAGRSLILQGHVDVVPTGPAAMWRRDPFDPAVEGDWLYGRGGADMKAGHAASFAALSALRRLGLQPAATVYIQSVVEEESTGNGALMTHLRGYRADAVLIPEPMGERLVRANVGVLWFDIDVAGVPVHVREMTSGSNAIDAAHRVVADLRGLEADWNAQAAADPHFAAETHPINLNVGRIEGGDWASSVPSWCRVACRISFLPGTEAADAAAAVRGRIAEFARTDPFLSNTPPAVTFTGFHAAGYVLDPGSEAEAVLGRAHRAATGEDLRDAVSTAYLDARVYALYDQVPALCYGPVSRNIHGVDECVSLSSLQRVTTAIALFVAEWCGLESVTP